MIKIACIIVALAQLTVVAQSTIEYFSAKAFYIPFSGSRSIDFDGDGRAEFTVDNGGMLCTADVPTSACSTYYTIGPEEGSAYLTNGNSLEIFAEGDQIGPSPSGASWDSA